MNNIISIVISIIFAFIVYLGFCKKGFVLGYALNFLYGLAGLFLQNQNPEITIITIATILLVTAIITFIEYIAYQKTQSFLGYVAYVVLIVVVIIIVIYLTKVLFTFLGDPSVLFQK